MLTMLHHESSIMPLCLGHRGAHNARMLAIETVALSRSLWTLYVFYKARNYMAIAGIGLMLNSRRCIRSTQSCATTKARYINAKSGRRY